MTSFGRTPVAAKAFYDRPKVYYCGGPCDGCVALQPRPDDQHPKETRTRELAAGFVGFFQVPQWNVILLGFVGFGQQHRYEFDGVKWRYCGAKAHGDF